MLLILVASKVYAQPYINKLYDFDTTNDWGHTLFQHPDGSYLILGADFKNSIPAITSNQISIDGNVLLDKKEIYRLQNESLQMCTYGRIKKLFNGNYLVCITGVSPQPNTNYGSYFRSGLAVLDVNSDTIFTRLYTDTSKYKEILYDCLEMPDGGYLLAGARNAVHTTQQNYAGLLYRTDSNGKIMWEKTYSDITDNEINSIQLTKDGNILIGLHVYELHISSLGDANYKYRPWFIVADSNNGAIIKSRLYTYSYAGGVTTGGGNIFEDKNGGYFHWGQIDSKVIDPWEHYLNFPPYFARLDSDFNFVYIKTWQPTLGGQHRYIMAAEQTSDNGYILIGSTRIIDTVQHGPLLGWAAKLNKNGFVVWEHTYTLDSGQIAYLVDAYELPDKGFAFTGSYKLKNTSAQQTQDIWLIRVDSNGCNVPDCNPTEINQILPKQQEALQIYPNPTYGQITVNSETEGKLLIYSTDARLVGDFIIEKGKNSISLPDKLYAGVYVARFITVGNIIYNFRLVYQK